MIRDVDESNLAAVRAFLEKHLETSLFLLGNLDSRGPRRQPHPYSGNFRVIEEGGAVAGVFCLTNRGACLVQTGGRDDLGSLIVADCAREPIDVKGAVGEWRAAQSVWRELCRDPGFRAAHVSKDVLYAESLDRRPEPAAPEPGVRSLSADDFDQWDPLRLAYLTELSLPSEGSRSERRALFASQAAAGLWWGLFEAGDLAATAGLNATYGRLGQVGGVYTRPGFRRHGFARRILLHLRGDARIRHGIERLILFTGGDNLPARHLYESLDFEACGEFGLLFGSRAS